MADLHRPVFPIRTAAASSFDDAQDLHTHALVVYACLGELEGTSRVFESIDDWMFKEDVASSEEWRSRRREVINNTKDGTT